jgi:hypothetical protein
MPLGNEASSRKSSFVEHSSRKSSFIDHSGLGHRLTSALGGLGGLGGFTQAHDREAEFIASVDCGTT